MAQSVAGKSTSTTFTMEKDNSVEDDGAFLQVCRWTFVGVAIVVIRGINLHDFGRNESISVAIM